MSTPEGMRLTERQRQERGRIMLTCLLGTLLFCMTFNLVSRLITEVSSDYGAHIRYADELKKTTILSELLHGNDRLWHIFVWFLMRTGMESVYAASMVTALANVSLFSIMVYLLRRMLSWIDQRLIPVAALVLCLVGPIYMPWFSEKIYRGQDSPNVWHNPTQLMVRPFALLVFWLTVRIYRRLREGNWPSTVYASRKEAAVYTLLITLSVWAKPSFVQAFVPGLGIVMIYDLIRSKGKSFLPCVKIATAYLPAAFLIVQKFLSEFYSGSDGGGVEIAPFVYWSHNTSSVPISFLLLFAFPLLVFCADWKRIRQSEEGQIVLATTVVATAMRALLIETGERRWHGNFGWAYGLSSMLVWFLALRQFMDMMSTDRLSPRKYKVVAYLGWTLLALHLLTGILYYYQLMTGSAQC